VGYVVELKIKVSVLTLMSIWRIFARDLSNPVNEMKIGQLKNVNYIGGIVIILAFVFLYFSYFFIYIPRQESLLQQRAFRILKEYGNNMSDKNNYYKNHFKNYGLYYKIRFFSQSDSIARKDGLNHNDSIKFDEVREVVDGLYAYVINDTREEDLNESLVFSNDDDRLFLNFNTQIPASPNEESIRSVKQLYTSKSGGTETEKLLNWPVTYKVPVKIFMEGLVFDELFQTIVLFDESGVYYNSNLEFVTDITNTKALCDSVENAQGGIWKTLNIRGEDKHIMILPIDFLGKRFCLAGFIVGSKYTAKTRTINNQLLIFIAAVLLLILIGLPILKVIFIDQKERLNTMDASGGTISTVFGIGLLVLITIGILKHTYVDRTSLSDRIIRISDNLYKNVTSDIDSIKNLYISICDSNAVKTPQLSQYARKIIVEKDKKFQQYGDSIMKSPFPLNEIILINSDGIVSKAVTSTPFSEVVPIDLSERQYFINVADSQKAWPSDQNMKFYIESIKSYNTGDGETAISFHTERFESLPVLAITSAIPSLYHQVLPKDVEYLVINNSGKVLYHSIKTKNLHENFLDECDSDKRLKIALDLRTEDILQIDYNEKKWLARILPLEDTPLFHITLIDLTQTDNKNARIFLFTFYFLVISLVIVGIGMLIIRWIIPREEFEKNRAWFLIWLFYQPEKYKFYKGLSVVLAIVIAIQFSGIFVLDKPVSILLYQLIFIVYTSFVSLIFLKRGEFDIRKLIRRDYFPENIILSIVILLVFALLWKFSSSWIVVAPPLAGLFLLTMFLPVILQRVKRGKTDEMVTDNPKASKIRRTYLGFLFLWLASLSAIPVIQYYFSIKNQEELYWKQEQLFFVAQKNLALQKKFSKYTETPWFKSIQGNGLDSLKVAVSPTTSTQLPTSLGSVEIMNQADFIYAMLPDPVTHNYGSRLLMNGTNYTGEWVLKDSLVYTRGGEEGVVSVTSNQSQKVGVVPWVIRIFFAFVIFAVSIWVLLKYIASVLLNLNVENRKVQKISWVETLFGKNPVNRILLHSFNGDHFLRKTTDYNNETKTAGKTQVRTIKTITSSQLADPDFDVQNLVSQSGAILWISGFDESVYEINKHEPLLDRLLDISRQFKGKIILDLAFQGEFIEQFYDEYIDENEIGKEETGRIFFLRKKWKLLFKDYIEFNGYLNYIETHETKANRGIKTEMVDAKDSSPLASDTKALFSTIWDNLTSYEKIVLYDLADDGLLNRKNKQIINQLIDKQLIVTQPYPKLFSDGFTHFVVHRLNPSEVKTIEHKLGLHNKWRNMRYLILLILVPLAAFIFISQGFSIEKIFGIFAGVLTVVTGAMKLFDSHIFRQASE
jgi:hypothetical protein